MKLLIAVDDSEDSSAAVRQAAQLNWPAGTSVLLLAAVRADVFKLGDFFVSAVKEIEQLLRDEAERAEQRLGELARELSATGLAVSTRVTQGDPRLVIVDTAEEQKSDLVIVGSHGRSGLKRLMLGSVASYVVTNAPCSVLVVKRPAA